MKIPFRVSILLRLPSVMASGNLIEFEGNLELGISASCLKLDRTPRKSATNSLMRFKSLRDISLMDISIFWITNRS